jgi:hypothetical protein
MQGWVADSGQTQQSSFEDTDVVMWLASKSVGVSFVLAAVLLVSIVSPPTLHRCTTT